jgi:hypothetical protein
MNHAAMLKNGRRLRRKNFASDLPRSSNYPNPKLPQSPTVGKLHDERVNDSRFSVGQLFKLYNKDATVSFKDDTFDL